MIKIISYFYLIFVLNAGLLLFQCSVATFTLVKDLNILFNGDKIPNIHA